MPSKEEWNERHPDYPDLPGMTKGRVWTEKNGRAPLWTYEKKQQLEKRSIFNDLRTLVMRLAKANWPTLEEIDRLPPKDAARARQALARHLKVARERLSTYQQALEKSR